MSEPKINNLRLVSCVPYFKREVNSLRSGCNGGGGSKKK